MQVMTKVNWLGMQNAARKYRDGSRTPGAWIGGIVHTAGEVTVSITQVRWDKAKGILRGMKEQRENGNKFPLKKLLSERGYLTYISQTYTSMVPYMKGIHLTVDSWRDGRDDDGWKLNLDARTTEALRKRRDGTPEENLKEALKEVKEAVDDEVDSLPANNMKPSKKNHNVAPLEVHGAKRLGSDLEALDKMFSPIEPVKRHTRAKHHSMVKFGFSDASGDGYGSGLGKLKSRPNLRFGKWGIYFSSSDVSSNNRELRTIVDGIEIDYHRGLLDGHEVFFFTDNAVAEKAYYKGTSSSKELFELVLRLRLIEMDGRMILHVIHVSGKRMIACGIDGLSRGDTTEGIAAGITMDNYVPLHLNCLDRSPRVLEWVKEWWPEETFGKIFPLEPEDWYSWDEEKTNCLWTPAPAGGETAVEELANWIHHTPEDRIHVIIMPTIWTCKWRRQLGKVCDLSFALPNVFEFWNREVHFEPLTIGIFVPYLNREPWRIKHHETLGELVRKMRSVQEDPHGSRCGNILREFLHKARDFRRVL